MSPFAGENHSPQEEKSLIIDKELPIQIIERISFDCLFWGQCQKAVNF